MAHKLTEDTYLTKTGKAVPRGHSDAHRALGKKGQAIPKDVADRLGLTAKPAPKKQAAKSAPKTKAKKAPEADK